MRVIKRRWRANHVGGAKDKMMSQKMDENKGSISNHLKLSNLSKKTLSQQTGDRLHVRGNQGNFNVGCRNSTWLKNVSWFYPLRVSSLVVAERTAIDRLERSHKNWEKVVGRGSEQRKRASDEWLNIRSAIRSQSIVVLAVNRRPIAIPGERGERRICQSWNLLLLQIGKRGSKKRGDWKMRIAEETTTGTKRRRKHGFKSTFSLWSWGQPQCSPACNIQEELGVRRELAQTMHVR